MYDALRVELHTALDRVFNQWLAEQAPKEDESPEVTPTGGLEKPFAHRWPDGKSESFSSGSVFTVTVGAEKLTILVARADETRLTWGTERRRAVSFWLPRGGSSSERYPLVEWVESDDGRMTAGVPDPARPRAQLKDGDDLPTWLESWPFARCDELFANVASGPSLRIALESEEFREMTAFAVRVGLIRGRFGVNDRRRPWAHWTGPPEELTSQDKHEAGSRPLSHRRPWKEWERNIPTTPSRPASTEDQEQLTSGRKP